MRRQIAADRKKAGEGKTVFTIRKEIKGVRKIFI